MNKLSFFFDYISHNAYLAWVRLIPLCEKYDLTLDPVPVLFGALLKANGQLGPAEIRDKSLWMLRDVLRKSRRYGIPIAPPASHPFNPLAALRATCVSMTPVQRSALVTALFEATWLHARDVSDPVVVADVMASVGLDSERVASEATSAEVKSRLRQHTDEALAAGVFGVPTMILLDRLFWGFDDLDSLAAFAAGEDPFRNEELTPWLQVKPSIRRERK